MNRLQPALKLIGIESLREHQKPVIDAILAKRDVLAVMPTGAGKSLCFQLPALVEQAPAIVISPLIALMQDQVANARARGIAAYSLHSGNQMSDELRVPHEYKAGRCDLIYMSPERATQDYTLAMLSQRQPTLIAIDEAHCITRWGKTFRPAYRDLAKLRQIAPGCPIAAFTATATPECRQDIAQALRLRSPMLYVSGFDRPNLRFEAMPKRALHQQLLDILYDMNGSGIIYRTTRTETERTAAFLNRNGYLAGAYHAGMCQRARQFTQQAFIENQIQCIVATVAFGMGIDKPDIRWVIHGSLPASIEDYYQQVGRAGRDGEPGRCILISNYSDTATLRHLADQTKDPEERERAHRKAEQMVTLARLRESEAIRKMILAYFDSTD